MINYYNKGFVRENIDTEYVFVIPDASPYGSVQNGGLTAEVQFPVEKA